MSMRCEDIRPLLAELVYEEVDPELAEKLREHLGTCLSCRRYQMAFTAVRKDLQEWRPANDAAPSGMKFIAPGTSPAPPIWHSRVFQGLAAAAGFAFVAVLAAAAVNLQVRSGPEGWALSTSFGTQGLAPAEAAPPTVALEQIPQLDTWFNARLDSQLDSRLAERGVVTLASMPEQQFFTEGQVQELNRRINGIFDETFAERDLQIAAQLDDLEYRFNASLDQQGTQFFYSVANLVESVEADHRDQIFDLTQYYSNLYTDTDRKVEEANMRIDTLLSLAAPTRSPEQ
jgi:hypothetical protein